MAVDDALISRPGSINNSFATEAAASAIFLKVFAGEVLDAFDEYNVMQDLVLMRTISSGKEAQFPILGRAIATGRLPTSTATVTNLFQDAAFANQIKSAEKVISVDGPLTSVLLLDEFDELRIHYDVRSMKAAELGRAISEEYDRRALIMVGLGARSASLITASGPDNDRGGIVITDADFNTNGASAVASLFDAQRRLDDKFVPAQDRHLVVSPQCYSNLAQQTDLLNRDWTSGRNGQFEDGSVYKVAGFQIHKSTHVPSTNIAANLTGAINSYVGDFSTTVALAFHKSGVGAVSLRGMSMESEYMIEYQSYGFVAKRIVGLGFLRPEACVEIKTA